MASQFGAADFVVFIGTLLISLSIGVFYAIKDRKKKNLENYNYGGKNMAPFPVGMSIAVSYISAITLVSMPTETYLYGTVMTWYIFHIFITILVSYLYYIPLVHRLKLYTIYEFLELRFHYRNRMMCACLGIVRLSFYMGLCLYVPALSLNAVTPLSLYGSIATVGVVCTFYTTIGGMKAVIWTDAIQALIMFAGALAAMIKTIIDVGGVYQVQQAIEHNNRNNFLSFDPNPFVQRTFWTLCVGVGFAGLQQTGTQVVCQRYLSCKSVKHARRAIVYSMIPAIIFPAIAVVTGCAMYAYFQGCDPVKNGDILKNDQLLPFLVVKIFDNMPGMAGLFVSAAFSGTFSSVSSGINTISTVILEDVMSSMLKNVDSKIKLYFGKALSLLIGIIAMSIAFIATKLDGTVMSAAIAFSGCVVGPIIGVLTLGMLTPWCTSVGAFIGQIVGTACTFWVMIGSTIYGKSPDSILLLPLTSDQCDVTTSSNSTASFVTSSTTLAYASIETEDTKPALYYSLYSLSYGLYFLWGFLITVLFGLGASFATGANKASEANPKYFVPLIDNKIFPEKVRTFFRFGVPEYKEVKELGIISNEETKTLKN